MLWPQGTRTSLPINKSWRPEQKLLKRILLRKQGNPILSNGIKLIEASDCKACHHVVIQFSKSDSYLMFSNIDLTDLSEVTYSLAAEGKIDSPDGPMISEAILETTKIKLLGMHLAKSKINATLGLHSIYFIYKNISPRPKVREVLDLALIGLK